jgi:hypothetical protein
MISASSMASSFFIFLHLSYYLGNEGFAGQKFIVMFCILNPSFPFVKKIQHKYAECCGRVRAFFAQKRKKEGRSLNKYYLYNMDSRETFPEGRKNLFPKSLCSPRKKEKYTKEKRINIHFLQSRETPKK